MQRAFLAVEAESVREVLHGYATRGFLHSVGDASLTPHRAEYRVRWHYDRLFTVRFDSRTRAVSIPVLLPGIPARSEMYKALRAFVHSFASPHRPAHRRIEPERAKLTCRNHLGTVSLEIQPRDRDLTFATRKLVHVAHEVFMVFLRDGPYYEYRVARLGLNSDSV
jgi:hypothetical protein